MGSLDLKLKQQPLSGPQSVTGQRRVKLDVAYPSTTEERDLQRLIYCTKFLPSPIFKMERLMPTNREAQRKYLPWPWDEEEPKPTSSHLCEDLKEEEVKKEEGEAEEREEEQVQEDHEEEDHEEEDKEEEDNEVEDMEEEDKEEEDNEVEDMEVDEKSDNEDEEEENVVEEKEEDEEKEEEEEEKTVKDAMRRIQYLSHSVNKNASVKIFRTKENQYVDHCANNY
ncbi:uncharacterized protein LOC142664421 [Rhinoderma darwinii]|uniref:uncharacterized protein LOC142664421 n=1 Tax=Rhinoderma darwinii TaxID=43563 RepID=UPI003F671BDB